MSSPKGGLRPFQPCKFARYTLLNPIAKGGMGEVFLAQMTGAEGFEKLIIIKKILPALAEEGDFVQRFVAEAKILVQLHHGAIAQILDMGVEGGSYYIAMEFVDGKDLRKLLSRARDLKARVPAGLALYIIVRILDALAYAHRKTLSDGSELNLVHRDISPQNILVSYEGEVKLIDFGLAKSSAAQQQKTRAGMVVGKIFYMPPEQALHEIVDKRSDLYSAGICLWEMLAGKNPFDTGESALMLMHRVSNPEVPAIRTIRPDLPESLDAFLRKAIAPDPDERFASAEEMRGRLTAVMMELDPLAGPESLAGYMRQTFAADFENERRHIAALTRAIPKDESACDAAESAARAAPKLSATRQIPTASALKPETLRPFAPLGDQPQERSLSGKRPRRATAHEQAASARLPLRETTAPAEEQRAAGSGRSLEDPCGTPQPGDTDPAKTLTHLSAAEAAHARRSPAEQRGAARTDSKTRRLSRESLRAHLLLEGEAPQWRTGAEPRTLPPQAPPTADTAEEEGAAACPRAPARDRPQTAGRRWPLALLAGVAIAGAGAGAYLMKGELLSKLSSLPAPPSPPAAAPAAHAPDGVPTLPPRPRAEPLVPPAPAEAVASRRAPLPERAAPEVAQPPPRPRAPDKARAALQRGNIPNSMAEISSVFRALSAEFTALKKELGCERLAMMCEFHAALAKQHAALVENAKHQIPPATYPRDRRNFWENLKLLEASIGEQQKKWRAPSPAAEERGP